MKPWPAVVILNSNEKVLTFHRFGSVKPRQGDPSAMLTACGRRWATYDGKRRPELAFSDSNVAWLRGDHAERLGKPCRKCWPDLGASGSTPSSKDGAR